MNGTGQHQTRGQLAAEVRRLQRRLVALEGPSVLTLTPESPEPRPPELEPGKQCCNPQRLQALRPGGPSRHGSDERLCLCVENLLDCFGIFSPIRNAAGTIVDFAIEYLNQAACRDRGKSLEQLQGQRLHDIYPAARASGLFDAYCRVVQTCQPVEMTSVCLIDPARPQAAPRFLDLHAVKLEEGFAASWRDVTERHLIHEALRQNKERFEIVCRATHDVIWDWDLLVHRVTWSDTLLPVFGHSPRDVGGGLNWWYESIHPEDRVRVVHGLHAVIDSERPHWREEYRFRRRDGTYAEVLNRGYVVYGPTGRPVRMIGSMSDVTEEKRAAAELLSAKEAAENLAHQAKILAAQAQSANQAKDQFLAQLSHELRTPLSAVLATLQSLEQEARVPAAIHGDWEMIRRNVELETKLIDDLLDLTRISRGKLELDRRPCDLHDLLNHALQVCQADLQAKGLELVVDLQATRRAVEADAARLQQVFWNLLKNAIKFTPTGGKLTLRSLNADPASVTVQIIDTGIGIEPAKLQCIFDAFEQGHETTTRRFGGLGLGLTISRALIDLHGGTLEASSPGPGLGATFAVRLTTVSSLEFTVPHREPTREAEHTALHILLVEDHADTAQAMARLLGAMGHQVQTAASVADALAQAQSQCFDLLLSDIGLPDGSGLDLMRQLRATGSPLRGIVLSGYGMEDDVRRSLEAGFIGHLTKPVAVGQLRAALERVGRC